MIITYQEENYFKIQSGDKTILIDPTNQRSMKGASVVIYTSATEKDMESSFTEGGAGSFVSIWHQGEYEIGGIHVRGWSIDNESEKEKTMYKIQWDDISIGVLGFLTKELDTKTLFTLQETDILIAPAGGKPYLQQSSIAKYVRQLEPGIIIPSLFGDLKLFLKELGAEEVKPEEKLTIKKKDIVDNAMKVVVLSPTTSGK